MELSLGLIAAYLLGSIPFALVTVWLLAGVDIRKIGSGNVGASNAARAFGKRSKYFVFLLVYLLDFGKGLVASMFLPQWIGSDTVLTQVLLGSAAILGHCTSPILGFRGGKGVATATGVAFVLAPIPLAIGIGAYALTMLVARQAFLGSFALVIALNVAVWVEADDPLAAERLPVTVFCLVLLGFLVFTHRGNIRKFQAARKSST